MMYQCLSAIAPAPSAADAEHEGHDKTHDEVGNEEEHRCDGHHDENHGGGDRGFTPRRPGDLLALGAHFLQKLERTDLCHSSPAAVRVCGNNPSNEQIFRLSRLCLAGVEGL